MAIVPGEVRLTNLKYVAKAQRAFAFVLQNQIAERRKLAGSKDKDEKNQSLVYDPVDLRQFITLSENDKVVLKGDIATGHHRMLEFRIKFATPEDALMFTLLNHEVLMHYHKREYNSW